VELLVANAAAELTTFYYYKDHRTYALSLAILNEEIEHESWVSKFLGEGPSGHFVRTGETSPFVRPFMPG
jgi:ferritin-like protein